MSSSSACPLLVLLSKLLHLPKSPLKNGTNDHVSAVPKATARHKNMLMSYTVVFSVIVTKGLGP